MKDALDATALATLGSEGLRGDTQLPLSTTDLMASQTQRALVTLPYKMLSTKKGRRELLAGRMETRLRKRGKTRI